MLRDMLSTGLIAAGWVALGVSFLLLFLLYRREAKANRAGNAANRTDVTNMTIVLQTMRDLLGQQKALARDLNKSLDNKVAVIRKVVRAVADEHDRLNRTYQELNRIMAATKADLARIRAHARAIRATRADATRPGASASAPDTPPPEEEPAPPEAAPALQALAQPIDSDSTSDLIDNWVGLDFGGDEPSPYAFEVPEEAPQAPEDPETAREAFRKLLKLSANTPQEGAPAPGAAPGPAPDRDNGRSRSATLRARVLEYSEAGMSVPEIARELGLGRGEVRLILSIGAKEAHHLKQRRSQRKDR